MKLISKYFPHILLFIYVIEFIFFAFHPYDRAVWLTENLTVLPIAVILAILYYKNIKFSNTAYALMSVLIYMHTIGGHYTFALVPFDWFNDFFGFERNMYDRVAHMTVGFYSYPIIEAAIAYKVVNKSGLHIWQHLRLFQQLQQSTKYSNGDMLSELIQKLDLQYLVLKGIYGMLRKTCSWIQLAGLSGPHFISSGQK
jgi:uncharacterized membrane protein YjdF